MNFFRRNKSVSQVSLEAIEAAINALEWNYQRHDNGFICAAPNLGVKNGLIGIMVSVAEGGGVSLTIKPRLPFDGSHCAKLEAFVQHVRPEEGLEMLVLEDGGLVFVGEVNGVADVEGLLRRVVLSVSSICGAAIKEVLSAEGITAVLRQYRAIIQSPNQRIGFNSEDDESEQSGLSADRYRGRLTGYVWNLLDTRLPGFDVETFEGDVIESAISLANDEEKAAIAAIRERIKAQAARYNHNVVDQEAGKAEGIYVSVYNLAPAILSQDSAIDFNNKGR